MNAVYRLLLFVLSFAAFYVAMSQYLAGKNVSSNVSLSLLNSALCLALVSLSAERHKIKYLIAFLPLCIATVMYVNFTNEIFFQLTLIVLAVGFSMHNDQHFLVILAFTAVLVLSLTRDKQTREILKFTQSELGMEETTFYEVKNYMELPHSGNLLAFFFVFIASGYFIKRLHSSVYPAEAIGTPAAAPRSR